MSLTVPPRMSVLEGMSEGFVALDHDFNVTYVNAAAEKLAQQPREEMSGRSLWSLFPDTRDRGVESEYRQAMEGRTPRVFLTFHAQERRWFEVNVDPRDDGGLSVYFRDVTERRRNATLVEGQKRALELAVSGAPLREILEIIVLTIEEHASDGVMASILLLDRDGVHLRHGAAPHLPQGWNEVVDGEPIGPLAGSCGTAAWTRERVIVHDIASDARWTRYRDTALAHGLGACWSTPILSRSGDVLGTFALYHREAFTPPPADFEIIDLLTHTAAVIIERDRQAQERVIAEEQLLRAKEEAERANRAKDQFLAMLAHELRNPLAPIVTALELAELRGDRPTAEHSVIERQVAHLVRLVEDLLDMARFARGKVELRRECVEMSEIVAHAVEMARPLIDERQHSVHVDIRSGPTAINGDPVRLAQIASNLIANAAKYTERGGRIDIRVERAGEEVVLRVRDNGIGLSPEMSANIFEAFVQERDALQQAPGGLGLGLAIVRTLVDLHGGRVEAHSDGRGRGSEFVVSLPAAAGPSAHQNQEEAPHRAPAEHRRVLIVDDNEDAASLLGHTLRRMGYEVAVANDGRAGLREAVAFRPDVALLDISLPFLSGYELGRAIREQAGLDGVCLIAVTGSGHQSDLQRSIREGFNAHLVKPISIRTLARTLEELVPE